MLTSLPAPSRALEGRPFGPALDQRFLYPSRSHVRTVAEVREALRRRDGLIVVTGDAGTGKTLLCRTLLQEMQEAAFVSVILDPRLAEDDLMAHILTDFGVTKADLPIPAHVRRRALTAALQGFLRELIPVNGYAVIIVDEAQHLNPAVLEQLRLLMNFETDEAKLLQVVLVGQRDLERRLREPDMRAFDQRVARRCETQPLSGFEVRRYIERRLATAQQLAGSWRGTFTPSASRAVAAVSGGVPRVINQICDLALELGGERQTRVIDARTVRAAARRLNLHARGWEWQWKTPAAAAAVFTLVAGGAMASWGPAFGSPVAAESSRASSGLSYVGAGFSRPEAAFVVTGVSRPITGNLATSNSINVQVGSFKSAERAAATAAQVHALALPAFTRLTGEWHQVVVGPYVTEDEAATAQRGLVAHGFNGTRILTEGTPPSGTPRPAADDRVLLLTTGVRTSVVLQLADEPKKVATRQVDSSTLEIDAGPVVSPHDAQRLTAATASPVAEVGLENVTSARASLLRARIALRGATRSDVRVVGRRVYVDLVPASEGRLKPAPTYDAPTTSYVGGGFSRPEPRAQSYDDAIAPTVARLRELEPFLLSATSAPTPQVLTAIGGLLRELEASLHAVDVPEAKASAHASLLSAVVQARRSVDQDFSADRAKEARQAIAAMQAAGTKES